MNNKRKKNCTVRLFSNKRGLVLGATGVLQSGKPSAGRDRTVNRKLNINAEDNYALAA